METGGKSIAQLSVLLQQGALDPVTLAEATLDAVNTFDDQSIFTCLTPERARAEAQASAKRIRDGRSLGLLDGIPIAWKDLFDLEGLTTTAGSRVLAANPPAAADAQVVSNLHASGMVAIGRTNMSEFAFSGIGINPHYGTPKNPAAHDAARVPGGSSSGAGVAVAAGLVPVAMGTDTGGSIRIPAAFNGVVGYKGTRGRYEMNGVYPLSTSLDSLGPLCRTVQDAIWVDAAMRACAAPTVVRADPAAVTLVVPETIVFDDAEPEVVSAFEAALSRLAAKGIRIRRQAFPIFTEIFQLMERHGPLVTVEAYALHKERILGEQAAQMDARVVARTRLGERTTAADYIAIVAARERLIRSIGQQLARGEFLASPTLPHVAPSIEPLLSDDDLFIRTNARTLRNTLVGNFLDVCAVSIPCGTGHAGMPVGFQLAGLADQDEHLLGLAWALEPMVRGEA